MTLLNLCLLAIACIVLAMFVNSISDDQQP